MHYRELVVSPYAHLAQESRNTCSLHYFYVNKIWRSVTLGNASGPILVHAISPVVTKYIALLLQMSQLDAGVVRSPFSFQRIVKNPAHQFDISVYPGADSDFSGGNIMARHVARRASYHSFRRRAGFFSQRYLFT
jgi:hypothetical protein